MAASLTGAVLAGGQSRRFGSNKAIAKLAGRALIEHVLEALGRVCDPVLVVGGDPRDYWDLPAELVADEEPGLGPLGGLATALGAAPGEGVLLVACDMPLVTGPLLSAVAARAGEADVVIPEDADGLQPLCAAYSKACLGPVRRALARADRSMTSFHAEVRVLKLPAAALPGARGLASVNTPEELLRLEAELADRTARVRAEARRIAARLRVLPADEMRRAVLREELCTLEAAVAAEVLHALLTPDAPRRHETALAAAAAVAVFSGGEALPYGFAMEIYESACARGYEEVRRLLLKPAPRSEASPEELRVDRRLEGKTLGERKALARRSDPFLLDRLLYDPDPAVLLNLLHNPRLTEREAVRIASHRPSAPDVLRALARDPRFGKRERVRRALVRNPYTPTEVAINLLPFLSAQDLRASTMDGALHAGVREAAERILEERRKGRGGPEGGAR
jgi:molybdopterin-guanine dinucleotide biosynthesis protein A